MVSGRWKSPVSDPHPFLHLRVVRKRVCVGEGQAGQAVRCEGYGHDRGRARTDHRTRIALQHRLQDV